jgi:hypothetical protein
VGVGEQNMSNDHSSKDDIARFDYERALQSFQMMADIRFKLLALVPLVSGTGIAFLTIDPVKASQRVILAGGLFGFLVTLGVTIYNQRNTQLMNVLRCRAYELEEQLPLTVQGHFHLNPDKSVLYRVKIGADRGLAIIYSTVLAAWVFLIMRTALGFFLLLWVADVIAGVVSLIVGWILRKEILRLEECSKQSAKKLVKKPPQTSS